MVKRPLDPNVRALLKRSYAFHVLPSTSAELCGRGSLVQIEFDKAF